MVEAQDNDDVPGELMAAAGETNAALLELDHVIPLELGGGPLDCRNLQRQRWAGECSAKDKDRLEAAIGRLNGVEACGVTIQPLAAAYGWRFGRAL